MGIYVNPSNKAFTKALNSKIYIDKTKLIAIVNDRLGTSDCYLCVSRPRRFGKSMAADMLVAYYSKGCDSSELFIGKEIEKDELFKAHLNQHNVIRLDMQQFLFHTSHLNIFIDQIQKAVIKELRLEFGNCFEINEYGLQGVLKQLYANKGESFIIILDEWDCVFRLAKEQKKIQKDYLDFLRGLFKGNEYVDLAYMTGILPIKKYGEHSAINIFDEYSMLDSADLAEFFGFTEKEVLALCLEKDIDFTKLQQWYDGYILNKIHIYNPKSVTDVIKRGNFKSYWTGTETYEALKVYIDLNFDGLKEAITAMLGNCHCKIDPSTFQNDMTTLQSKDDVLTLLVHLGYLAYDETLEEVRIPNHEIMQEFIRSIKVGGWDGLMQSLNRSEALLKSTWALDEKAVAKELEEIHNSMTSILKYNDENSLTCTILIAYYSAKKYYMDPLMELPSGKGFVDVVYLPRRNIDKPALIIELKWKKSAIGAIQQIKEKQYTSWLEGYTGNILLLGINYDVSKGHECIIEKYQKK